MSSFTNQEYLELCQRLVDQQYEDLVDETPAIDNEWIPAEPEFKWKKKFKPNVNGSIDMTDTKSNLIRDLLWKCTNIKVGNFKIRISSYTGEPGQHGALVSMRLEVWEERHKTPNGHPCKIDFPVNWTKDTRFTGRPWLKYFTNGYSGGTIPIDTVVDIIRWMQAIKKLTAFL
jgi:hypothetical protein